ncbi:MAG: hypothetical protein KIT83_17665 [Bryobacterales bacterium]|nr:hypothetical protein [Bryobacterales bacterium]
MHSLNGILGFKLHTDEDQFGGVHDIYFDDQRWTVRYIVVDTGTWLAGRQVLISPTSAGVPDWGRKRLPVSLNRVQIENSPPVSEDKPVSRQLEEDLAQYFGWPRYWAATGFAGMPASPLPHDAPGLSMETPEEAAERRREGAPEQQGDPHLQSLREVTGYRIKVRDGEIGHVEDFIADMTEWRIRNLLVDTRNWLPGKEVLVACADITDIDWPAGQVSVNMTKEQVQNAPAYTAA